MPDQEAIIMRMDGSVSAMLLFNEDLEICHANAKARILFKKPKLAFHDLPPALTAAVPLAMEKGTESFFRYSPGDEQSPEYNVRITPCYSPGHNLPGHCSDTPPPFAELELSGTVEDGFVPGGIVRNMVSESRQNLWMLQTGLVVCANRKSDPECDFRALFFRLMEDMIQRTITAQDHANDQLMAFAMPHMGRNETFSLAALVEEAHRLACKHRTQNRDVTRSTPKAPALQTNGDESITLRGYRMCLRTALAELLSGLLAPEPATPPAVRWHKAELSHGSPAVQIEFEAGVTDSALAGTLIMQARGRLEITPGKPSLVRLWLPLSPAPSA